jgi:hypothetical protein
MGQPSGNRHSYPKRPKAHTKRDRHDLETILLEGCMIITVQRFNSGILGKASAPCAVDVGRHLQVWGSRRDYVEEG